MNLRPLKYFCDGRPLYGLNVPAEMYVESGVRFLRTTDVGDDGRLATGSTGVYLDRAVVPSDYFLRDGDLLFSRSGTLGRCLLFRTLSEPSTHAGYLVRFRPDSESWPPYLSYCAQSQLMQDAVAADAIESTIGNFNAEKYANVRVPWWPKQRQRAIADYLDQETARIDALIASKQRMVELLAQRLRLSAHDLTTSTGDIMPLRRLVRSVKTGTTPPASEFTRFDNGSVPWYSPGDVGEWLQLSTAARTLKAEAVVEGWVPQFPPQSTLLVGIGATAGKVAFLRHAASGNQQMTCLVPGSRVVPRFLSWQLLARRDEMSATAPFTTLPIINNEFIRSLSMAVPSVSHQERVVRQLDDAAVSVDALAARAQDQVALLQARRQALITAAVTGQLHALETA